MKKLITFILLFCFIIINAQTGEEATKTLSQVIDKLEQQIVESEKEIQNLRSEISSLKEQVSQTPEQTSSNFNFTTISSDINLNANQVKGNDYYVVSANASDIKISLPKLLNSEQGIFSLYNEGNNDITISIEGNNAITYQKRKKINYYSLNGIWSEIENDILTLETTPTTPNKINGRFDVEANNLSGTYKLIKTTYASNLSSGQYLEQITGKEESLRNRYSEAFYYDGDRSVNNAYAILFYGTGESMRVDAKGDLTLKGSLKLNKKYKVSQLPKDGSINIAIVTDASSLKFRGTVKGGGSQEALVFWDSVNNKWVY